MTSLTSDTELTNVLFDRLLLLRLQLTALRDGFGRALMYFYLSGILIWHLTLYSVEQVRKLFKI